ncbi:MAG: hypothetical protein AAF085_03850 [Planctomycetota bacterium]
MSSYNDDNEDFLNEPADGDDGLNTMAVLNTIGGGEDAMAEGEPLGLDPDAGKAKLSGSTLAVGVVVVLGAVTLLGMKLTLGSITTDTSYAEAEAAITTFIATQSAAQKAGTEGPISAPDAESQKVLAELNDDPVKHQVPVEEVENDPFDISEIVRTPTKPPTDTGSTGPATDPRELAVKRAQAAASKFKVDGISGPIVFIDGKDYRIGDTIVGGQFELVSIDGLTCIIRTTDEHKIALRLRYR